MKRWWMAFGVTLLSCVLVFLHRSKALALLVDTDTQEMLKVIRARHDPLSWFTGDWPLGNHFYRPISTLTFEMDNALWGPRGAAGYGLTNALLCIGCVLTLFWFLRELTDKPLISAAGAAIFALWNVSYGEDINTYATWLVAIPLIGILLPGRKPLSILVAAASWLFVCGEMRGMWPLQDRMINWVPGRTASTMTLFALAAMAAYARYERISAIRRQPPAPTPFDVPSYKHVSSATKRARWPWLWAVLSCVCVALALGSYEQAVMLPAALVGVALTMRWQGFQVRFGWLAPFFLLLGGYLLLRHELLPSGVSSYQQQQLRSGGGVVLSIMNYVLPVYDYIRSGLDLFEQGLIVLILPQWTAVYLGVAETIAVLQLVKKSWVLPLCGWALSIVVFLPMAWVKHFEHYHYWPMAMRALFIAALLPLVWHATVSALSPRAVQAPPRPDPAPGSLAHR